MYTKGSEECLHNAELLINDAKTLMDNGSFGTAQSLSVTAFEEIGKAVILELANLNYVGKDIVHRAMYKHPPKKVILVGIEQSKLLLGENLASQASEYIIDKTRLKKLEKQMKDINHLENERQNGFYVRVDPKDGSIRNSPRRVSAENAQSLINKADVFLNLGKTLCEFFRNIRKRHLTLAKLTDVELPKYMWTGKVYLGEQPDYTIIIMWDEV